MYLTDFHFLVYCSRFGPDCLPHFRSRLSQLPSSPSSASCINIVQSAPSESVVENSQMATSSPASSLPDLMSLESSSVLVIKPANCPFQVNSQTGVLEATPMPASTFSSTSRSSPPRPFLHPPRLVKKEHAEPAPPPPSPQQHTPMLEDGEIVDDIVSSDQEEGEAHPTTTTAVSKVDPSPNRGILAADKLDAYLAAKKLEHQQDSSRQMLLQLAKRQNYQFGPRRFSNVKRKNRKTSTTASRSKSLYTETASSFLAKGKKGSPIRINSQRMKLVNRLYSKEKQKGQETED